MSTYCWRWNDETHIFKWKHNVYKQYEHSIILGWEGKALGAGKEESVSAKLKFNLHESKERRFGHAIKDWSK